MQQTYMSTHGMTLANNTVMVDGMMVNGLQLDGGVQSYFNDAMNQEVSYQTSGIGADTAAGGVRLNMIPREGGNRFSGDFKLSFRPGDWQSDNLTARHQERLTLGNAIDRIIDTTFALGGPLMRSKVWFFTSARYYSVNNFVANTFFDDGSPGIDDQYIKSAMARVTWQISPRNKLAAYFDEIDKYRGHDMQSNEDPETASLRWFSPAQHRVAEVDIDRDQSDAARSRAIHETWSTARTATRRCREAALHTGMVCQRVAPRERPRRPHRRCDQPDYAKPERHNVRASRM